MTGRIKIIRKVSSVVDGRRQQEETEFYSCWCEVKSLGTNEKYAALQTGLENTIVFETRTCDKMEEIRLNLKEFYAVYKAEPCQGLIERACCHCGTVTQELSQETGRRTAFRPITGGQETGKNQPHRKEAIHENDRTGTSHQNPASEKNVSDKRAKRET